MKYKNVLVSVVLPCYNAEAYIEKAVISILKQTHENLELIVVNDCSTDNSLQILHKVEDPRLKICATPKNSGYPTAMNVGIAQAKGKYVARMDADDICALDRIEMQVALHEKYPSCAFVSAKRCLLSPNGTAYTKDKIVNDDSFIKETWNDLYNGTRVFTDAASLVLKKHIEAVGGYNTYQRSGMDVDLWFRILTHTKAEVLVLKKFLYYRRLIPEAITFSVKTNNSLVFDKAYQQHYNKSAVTKKTVTESERLESYIRFLSTIAIHCLLVKDYKGFVAFFKKSLSYNKHVFKAVFYNMLKKYYHFKATKSLKVIHV